MLRKVVALSLVVPTAVVVASGPAPAAARPMCHGHAATIVGTSGPDRITGTRGPDVVVGLGGNDKIQGLGGDDVLCGGPGADDLLGAGGDDKLFGGADQHQERGRFTVVSGDHLEGGPGDDFLDAGADKWRGRVAVQRPDVVSYRHSAHGVTLDLRSRVAEGEGTDVVHRGRHLEVDGSRYDDVLLGSWLPETLDGGRGDDRVEGRGGRDAVIDYAGDDELRAGKGADFVVSTAGADVIAGGDGADWLIAGGRAPVRLLGGRGFDFMARTITERESGVIDGGQGGNQLELDPQLYFDGPRRSVLDAAAGTAVVTSGEQSHTTTFDNVRAFTVWSGRWTFRGSERNDFVQVVSGRLDAQGLGGDDYLLGEQRDDVLDGGDGSDTAWGGRGDNTCIDVESGSCTAYPWDRGQARTPFVLHRGTQVRDISPDRLVARWMVHPRFMLR
jgi:Ca2+-binding RTX toxin-like protein